MYVSLFAFTYGSQCAPHNGMGFNSTRSDRLDAQVSAAQAGHTIT